MAGARPDRQARGLPQGRRLLDDAAAGRLAAEAERLAEDVRERMNADVSADPAELFEHVYAQPTAALERQRAPCA